MGTPSLFSQADAVVSPCGRWRYRLVRRWNESLPPVAFIMLNPSTADAMKDDPTIRKCVGFAKRNGHGSLEVYNLFAYRSTQPKVLATVLSRTERIGPENDDYLRDINRFTRTVFAWGGSLDSHGWFKQRVDEIRGLFSERATWVVKQSRGKQPWHPLYVPYGEFLPDGVYGL